MEVSEHMILFVTSTYSLKLQIIRLSGNYTLRIFL